MAGYALECAFKVCIAKQVRQYDFPDKDLANKCYTHNLQKLLECADLKQRLTEREEDKTFFKNWLTVKDWSETSRYDSNVGLAKAREIIDAITNQDYGVLVWLKKYW